MNAVKRASRRGLDTTNSRAIAAPPTVTVARWVIGTPAIHATDEHDRRQHDRRAEVALREAEPGADPGEQRDRHDGPAGVDDIVGSTGEQVGGEHDHGELEELRRLDAEARRAGSTSWRR